MRSKLPNGMKVAVLSKKTANNIVTGTIELRFGDADDRWPASARRRRLPAAC